MSRLITSGFEVRALSTFSWETEGEGFQVVGAPVIETSTVRSGGAALKVSSNSRSVAWLRDGSPEGGPTLSRDRWCWLRTYVRAAATPSANIGLMRFTDAASVRIGEVRWIAATGVFRLFNKDVTNLGSTTAISANTWYCLELGIYVPTSGNGQLEMWVDGTLRASNASTNVGNSTPLYVGVGNHLNANPATDVFFDDVALNDDQGTEQNTRPGSGSIILMTPTSDNAVGGSWQAGAGATTNLWEAVNNLPPVGVAVASATDTSQVKNPTNEAASYDAKFPTYTAAGVPTTSRIAVVQALANGADNSASARPFYVSGVSDPVLAEGSLTPTLASAAAVTYPGGWYTVRSAVGYSADRTAQPVVRVRRDAAADTITYDLIGLYVESRPVQSVTLGLPSETDESQTQGRTKAAAVSQQTETDLAQAQGRRKDKALGQATETDSALTAAARKAIALGLGLETDAAQPFTALRSAQLGQATETDSASSLSALKQQTLGQPQETDEALPVTRQGVISAQLGIAMETDEALALVPQVPAQPVSPAFDWTPRRRIRRVTVVPLGIAKETDSALAFDVERNLSELQREEELLALV